MRVDLQDHHGRHQGTSLPSLIEVQVQRTPNAIAVTFGEHSLTFGELNARAARVARGLQSLGVGPNGLVGVALERSLDLLVALLGILKAGGAYLPLDPADPRYPFLVEDAGIALVLGAGPLPGTLPLSTFDSFPDTDLECSASDRDLAYVIYTSGSTGRPKGVAVEHRAIVNRLVWMADALKLGPDERILQKTPITFDVSVWELFVPLIVGARIILAAPGGHRDAVYLRDLIHRERVTTLHFVPSMLEAFLDCADAGHLSSVRRVVCSGEALSPALQDRFLSRFPMDLLNLYGPTEAAVDVTWWRCHAGSSTVPIGRPVANTRVCALDDGLRPVPPGTPGELCIGGVQLAREYWRRPDLTAERFIPDPACPEERLYRTGDRVIIREDGVVEYLGRMDDQVKVRGVRVELGEVEAALRLAPGVRQSAVVVCRGNLVAYVAPAGNASMLRRHMSALLPESMLPSRFVVLPVLPLTPHGKIHRAALPEPGTLGTGEPPSQPGELLVARLWEDALGVPVTGRQDDFFELGGQSLVATRILARLEAESGIRLTHADLFEARTVAAFADRIAATPGDPPSPTGFKPPPLKSLGLQQGPLSFAQKAIWITSQFASDLPIYNEPFTIRIPRPIDPFSLETALRALIARHDILRTAFVVDAEGVPQQVLREVPPLILRWSDLSALALPEREDEAARQAECDAVEAFDLARPPLLRARLVRFGPSDSRLYITLHHLIFDAHTIYYELLPDLRAFCEGRPPSRPLPAINHIDFAAWEQSWCTEAALAQDLAWWVSTLEGAVSPTLSGYLARPPQGSHRGDVLPVLIPDRRVTESRLWANSQGATLHMVLLTAFAAALRRLGGPDDLVIMMVDSGRSLPALEHVAGCFANSLLVRLDLQGCPPATKLLGRVRTACVDAYAHRSVPFLRLAETLAAERRPTFHQIAFVMEPEAGTGLGDWRVSQFETHTHTAKFELALLLEESQGGVVGRLNINTDRYTVDPAARLMAEYHSALQALVARPNEPLWTD